MNSSLVVGLMLAWLSFLGFHLARILKTGRAPSLIKVGYTPVGPDLEREQSPIQYWFSVLIAALVWLVSLGALLKFLHSPD